MARPPAPSPTASRSPLTVSFSNVPDSHDGSTEFTFDLSFSENFELSYRNAARPRLHKRCAKRRPCRRRPTQGAGQQPDLDPSRSSPQATAQSPSRCPRPPTAPSLARSAPATAACCPTPRQSQSRGRANRPGNPGPTAARQTPSPPRPVFRARSSRRASCAKSSGLVRAVPRKNSGNRLGRNAYHTEHGSAQSRLLRLTNGRRPSPDRAVWHDSVARYPCKSCWFDGQSRAEGEAAQPMYLSPAGGDSKITGEPASAWCPHFQETGGRSGRS